MPLALVFIYFFAPDYLLSSAILLIAGSVVFVAIKYYLVYPSLQEGSYGLYEMKDLVGKVFETVTDQSGKVKVGQEIWDARTEGTEIPTGAEVRVVSRESMKVMVEPLRREQ